ncbi:phosphatase PAP2 family protein [Paenibacillus agaridevorans]|uniref:phosphatase PAP2 family protein n=1 Tax=Paenibacillus agaridevorans TaxID=171404 RepID=UPI001BE46C3E|nr:phosphatase PAP2 family protein [Paenibacillus agaridevorans]
MVANKTIWFILLLTGAAGLAILWSTLPAQGGYAIDVDFHAYMARWASDGWTTFMKALDKVGSTAGLVALTLLIAAIMGWRLGLRQSVHLIGAMAAGYVLNTAIKAGVDRARPVQAWGIEVDGSSFPSGNAMLGLILFGLTGLFILSKRSVIGWQRGMIAALCGVIILLLGLSRLYFHVHYLSDIAAGYAGGLIIVAAVMLLFREGGHIPERKGRRRLS